MIIILGPTGAGKSSQAKRIEEQHQNYKWIELGGLLRESIDPKIKEKINQGLLISDDLVTTLIAERINKVDPATKIVLDGYPRSLGQASRFEEVRKRLGREIQKVIYLEVDRSTAERRLQKRRRPDDVAETIDRKWQIFESETLPVIKQYESKGIVERIDGRGSVDKVWEKIEKAVALGD